MPAGGLKIEAPHLKDFAREKVFGSAPFMEKIVPLNRDVSGIPVICQGAVNSCVSCSITWLIQYLHKDKPHLSWEWLAHISRTDDVGATPSQVLKPAKDNGVILHETFQRGVNDFNDALKEAYEYRLPGYFYVTDLTPGGIYHALKDNPIAIGVLDWQGVGPHFMVAHDVTEDGTALKCLNWWKDDVQDEAIVPFEAVVVAVDLNILPPGFDKKSARLPFFDALTRKARHYYSQYA